MVKKPVKSKSRSGALSFADLLSPMSEKEFFADYYGKRYVHIRGSEKQSRVRSDIFGWTDLNEMLNMAMVWSGTNMHIVLDKKMVSPLQFCGWHLDRNKQQAQVPEQALVMEWLGKGASIVLDDVDCLSVGSRLIAKILGDSFCAKVQANLYCSWKQRQAFDVHFDDHDVFAVHFEGEKVWNIYENCEANPVNHPSYKRSASELALNSGAIKEQVRLRAGDVLYLPKGQYHDALATEDTALHIAFGLHGYLGLDFVQNLLASMVAIEDFRKPLPLPWQGEKVLSEHIAGLARKITRLASSPQLLAEVIESQRLYRYPHHDFGLPIDVGGIAERVAVHYCVCAGDFKVIERSGKHVLVNSGRGVGLPSDIVSAVEWVLETREFSDIVVNGKFFGNNSQRGNKFLQDLVNMGVIEKV